MAVEVVQERKTNTPSFQALLLFLINTLMVIRESTWIRDRTVGSKAEMKASLLILQ